MFNLSRGRTQKKKQVSTVLYCQGEKKLDFYRMEREMYYSLDEVVRTSFNRKHR